MEKNEWFAPYCCLGWNWNEPERKRDRASVLQRFSFDLEINDTLLNLAIMANCMARGSLSAVREPIQIRSRSTISGPVIQLQLTQIGESVSCGANGDTVTVSTDGTRLSVSRENFRDPELGANTVKSRLRGLETEYLVLP